MGLDARKPVFGGLRTTQAQTDVQSDQHLCYSLFGKYHYVNLLQVKFQIVSVVEETG